MFLMTAIERSRLAIWYRHRGHVIAIGTHRHSVLESTNPLEVNISTFDVRVCQFNPKSLADIDPFKAAKQSPLNGRLKDADPGALVGGPSHNRFELLSDS
jgi:hypothetical protein